MVESIFTIANDVHSSENLNRPSGVPIRTGRLPLLVEQPSRGAHERASKVDALAVDENLGTDPGMIWTRVGSRGTRSGRRGRLSEGTQVETAEPAWSEPRS